MTNQETKDQREQQIKEILKKTDELLELIRSSEDYIRYQEKLKELKESKEMYQRVNDFRLRHMELEIEETEDNSYSAMQNLHEQFRDVLMEPLVSRFMIREQSLCKLIRKVQNRIADGVDLDISYLE